MTKSAGYPPQVLKDMLQVTYNEEAAEYDEERFKKREHDSRFMRLTMELLPQYITGSRVLELASGTGYWGRYISSLGYDYCGLEITDSMYKISREKGLNVIQGDVEDGSKYPKDIDTVVCIKAFGFFTNPIQVLQNVKTTLKPGGRFVNFYYNNRYHNAIVRLYSLFKDPDNISYQPPWDERFTWKQYKRMCSQVGLKVIYMRDCVALPYRFIPEKLYPIVDKVDSRLTHFGFITMAVAKK